MRDLNYIKENIGKKFRHFKGHEILVKAVAKHTEDKEYVVVYEFLKTGEYFARPLYMFLEEVPEGKDNPIGQKYRLELIE